MNRDSVENLVTVLPQREVMANKLTLKQRSFVEAYIESGNATQAAVVAYPQTTYQTQRAIACENLTKPHIQSVIENKLRGKEITVELVLDKLAQAIESEDPIIMLKACELAGKHLRMFDKDQRMEKLRLLENVKSIRWADSRPECYAAGCECRCHD